MLKIFTGTGAIGTIAEEVEEKINLWIEEEGKNENTIIKIISVLQSVGTSKLGVPILVITIFYQKTKRYVEKGSIMPYE
ncbi:MAG: hypothetical protein PHS07_01850 [Patescibacteria group bacterium]|jgi:hypothetical protein|nr:hypothetical protein [Patescibacteria group bacterium]